MTYSLDGSVLALLGLLDAVAVVLVGLVVSGVVLGLGHLKVERRGFGLERRSFLARGDDRCTYRWERRKKTLLVWC